MMRRSLATCSVWLISLLICSTGNSQTLDNVLQPGTPINRTLAAGETHSFVINLKEEQFLQFVVVQRGIDVTVQVFSPTGKNLGGFDTPNGADGPENCSVVAVTAGSYRIVIAPLEQTTPIEAGKYEIKTVELRKATEDELKIANDEARKGRGIALLNAIVNSIPEIRQQQTRVRVKVQAANLLWSVDDKKGARLITEAITESRNYLDSLKLDDESYEEVYRWVVQLRLEAVQTLALHDPEAALNLLRTTRPEQTAESGLRGVSFDDQFELNLAAQVAAKNPTLAYEIAVNSLKTGYQPTLIAALQRLRLADAALATKLSNEIVNKLTSSNLFEEYQALELSMQLLRTASHSLKAPRTDKSPESVTTILSPEDYRKLLQKLLDEAVVQKNATESNERDERGSSRMSILFALQSLGVDLDKVKPGTTAYIEKTLADNKADPLSEWQRYQETITSGSPDEALQAISQAPGYIKENLYKQLAEKTMNSGDFEKARELLSANVSSPRQRQLALINLERQAALREAAQGKMEEALSHVAKIPSLRARATIIGEFAYQIGPGYKRANALSLLENAYSLLGTTIDSDDATQMQARLQLAVAFSRYDSRRAFEIVEPIVNQFNELVDAGRVLNGFGGDFFVNGELSMQNGNALSAISQMLAASIGTLGQIDFDRAKLLSERFKLPEVRLPVALSIAQHALQPTRPYSPSAPYMNNLYR